MHFSLSNPRRLLSVLLAVLLGAGLLGVPTSTAQDGSNHMLWTVSKDGRTVGHLVGSVHFMKPDVYPLPSAYEKAFQASDVLVVETNLDSARAKGQGLIRQLGMYAGSKTLKGELADSTYTMLRARADSLGLKLARMQRMEPWVMSMVVPATQMKNAGYSGKSGIDRHFFTKAKKAGKKRVALETPAEQFKFFDQFSPDRQEAYLHYSLQKADRTVQMIDDMAAAWQQGDADELETLVQDEMQTNFPNLYQALIVERNQNWMPRITDLLAGEQRPMIVVGAGHVVGEDGLVAMLREKGCTVQQQ
ncbi:MAG: TraB/GumN family protein [Salinibacter sp.]|uniref:TraB/GumN family protein n=1 Tax=Salinibacter sp. TaxID=2065818 RepID=UPI0035D45673